MSSELSQSPDPEEYSRLDSIIEEGIENGIFPLTEAKAAEVLSQFNTNAERVRHFYGTLQENDLLPGRADVKMEKNDTMARAALAKGNTAFDRLNYEAALEAYNEALCFAPEGSKYMGFAYANRSLIYINTGFYEFCMRNIELALTHNYPEKSNSKLLKRMEHCAKDMATEKDAYELYGLPAEIELSHPTNEKIPFIADALDCATNTTYGRHIVTRRSLSPGDIVSLEKAFITVSAKQFLYASCYNCTAHNFYNLIPCPMSTRVMFCSEACADEAWERFYKHECPIIDGLFDWVSNNFVVRAILKAITAFEDPVGLKELSTQGADNPFDCDFINADERTKFRLFNALSTNQDRRSKLDTLRIVYNCATIFHILKEFTDLKDVLEDQEFETLFLELLMRFQQIECTNTFGMPEPAKRNKTYYNQFVTANKAQGVYLTTSFFSHSCAPNAFVFQADNRGKLGIVVLHPIKEGEQLCISYGPRFITCDFTDRQYDLKERFQFVCSCDACNKNFPMVPKCIDFLPSYQTQRLRQISPEWCRYDESSLKLAKELKDLISQLITVNFCYFPCAEIDALEESLLNAIRILLFKKPIDLVLQPRGNCNVIKLY